MHDFFNLRIYFAISLACMISSRLVRNFIHYLDFSTTVLCGTPSSSPIPLWYLGQWRNYATNALGRRPEGAQKTAILEKFFVKKHVEAKPSVYLYFHWEAVPLVTSLIPDLQDIVSISFCWSEERYPPQDSTTSSRKWFDNHLSFFFSKQNRGLPQAW